MDCKANAFLDTMGAHEPTPCRKASGPLWDEAAAGGDWKNIKKISR